MVKLVHPMRSTDCAIFQGLHIFLHDNAKVLYAVYNLANILYNIFIFLLYYSLPYH